MKKCMEICSACDESCQNDSCKHWIEFKEDLNCSLIAIGKNGSMTLREVGDRLGISFVRVKQIQEEAKDKMLRRLPLIKLSKNSFL